MEKITLTDNECALLNYIPDEKRVKLYAERMERCRNMDEVESRVLLPMLLHEPNITADNSEKKDFYTRLQPFIKHLRGSGSTSLYERIVHLNEILRRENRHKLSFAGLLQQIEVAMPSPGEEAHCIVELIITPSDEKGKMIAVAATLAGIEYRQVTSRHFDGESGVNASSTSYIIKGDTKRLSALLTHMERYWEDGEFSIRYKSTRIDREGLTLSQAIAFAENNV